MNILLISNVVIKQALKRRIKMETKPLRNSKKLIILSQLLEVYSKHCSRYCKHNISTIICHRDVIKEYISSRETIKNKTIRKIFCYTHLFFSQTFKQVYCVIQRYNILKESMQYFLFILYVGILIEKCQLMYKHNILFELSFNG